MKARKRIESLVLALLFGLSNVAPLIAADTGDKEADMTKPVQVFILLGQSNMVGAGHVGPKDRDGSLEHAVKDKGLYSFLVDKDGNWTTRKDVRYVRVMGSGIGNMKGFNNEFMTVKGGKLGPEYGIGHPVGNAVEAPVMILKSCIGNRSLGWDLLPPGTPRYTVNGQECPGYKETVKGKKDKTIVPFVKGGDCVQWYAGMQYDGDIRNAKTVLKELDKYYPGAKGCEVAGFFFWQGDKDRYNAAHAASYEKNLVNLIKALRKDFNAPKAKFVCATLGQTDKDSAKGNEKLILDAQMAIADPEKHPELKGDVATVYAHPLSKGGASNSHYGGNAETYMNVGEAMGKAMAELLKK